jgi:hypothetical protein
MGYSSDVVLMAVFANAEQHDEVMSVYRMNPKVQEHKLEEAWRRVDVDSGEVVRIYEGENVKWYASYDDVDALKELENVMFKFHEELENVMFKFHEERGFGYAWGYARIGENTGDVEYEVLDYGDPNLREVVYENLHIVRRLELNI